MVGGGGVVFRVRDVFCRVFFISGGGLLLCPGGLSHKITKRRLMVRYLAECN